MSSGPTISQDTLIKVPFFDVDSMNVAWHGHYLKYFEIARCNLLDSLGYNYQTMKETGFMFPIVEVNIKYLQPLIFNQEICVRAILSEWEFRLKISYEVYDHATTTLLTKAYTVQAAVDPQTKLLRIGCPDMLLEKVKSRLGDLE